MIFFSLSLWRTSKIFSVCEIFKEPDNEENSDISIEKTLVK